MTRRIGPILAALAMFVCAGGHWAVFQSIAWANMLRDYSRDASFSVALEKTFSGQYPCSMCKSLADAKKSEHRSKPAVVESVKKLETAPMVSAVVALFPPDVAFELLAPETPTPEAIFFDPPSPVPLPA
jgi:hypothetical protein